MGGWITINGTHVFIKDGESVEDAMARQFRESSHKGAIESSNSKMNEAIKNIKPTKTNNVEKLKYRINKSVAKANVKALKNALLNAPANDNKEIIDKFNAEHPNFKIVGYSKINLDDLKESSVVNENSNDEVVISEKWAVSHIFAEHPDMADKINLIQKAISNPDEVYETTDKKGTALGCVLLNSINDGKYHVLAIVKINDKNDPKYNKSAVLSARQQSDTTLAEFKNKDETKLITKKKDDKMK